MILSAKTSRTAEINDQPITLRRKETLLDAALRSGIDFPNSCRVGGCGACKCKLTSGSVKELTETGYLLSAEEIERGYILACQSVPVTDVRVEVDLARATRTGRVIEQEKVTHDITRVAVALDAPLAYRAGQFAEIGFEGLPGVTRSYSFATAASDDGKVAFYVRKVPSGRLSSFVDENDLVGASVRLEGPLGDFWLRPGDAPILMVAGGSGLSPMLAMLEEAAASGVARSVTLIFGARTERDLYALDRVEAIARAWSGAFRFVPVLSEAAEDATWSGRRGLVTDVIAEHLEHGAEAYLCGPPAMIDRAVEALVANGVGRERIRFDRFTTRADAASEEEATEERGPKASLVGSLHYLKYFLFHVVGLVSVIGLLGGGRRTTATLLGVLVTYIVGDALAGDDTSTPKLRHPKILTAQLWLALPLLALIVFVSVWTVCSTDPLGFGAWIGGWSGYDVLGARAATSFGHHVAAFVLTGLMIGMVGTIPAHELTHRTWDPVSMLVGRWLLAFSFDTTFAIEHVYGHHRYVSTASDPATAPRGRNVYVHVIASTIKGNVSAWKIEAERLKKRRLPLLSWNNAFLRGQAASAALVLAAFAMGGGKGALYFAACALWGKALLEIVNYMEHYGMVRNPATPVQPRHSWNTNRRVSSWAMFNLTRHSHHHAQGEVPYQDLRPYPGAPTMINGYLTTLIVAMIPPLWHYLMTPKVLAWDRDHATDEERVLAERANAASGLPAFQRTPRTPAPTDAHG